MLHNPTYPFKYQSGTLLKTLLILSFGFLLIAPILAQTLEIDGQTMLDSLLWEEDTDGDTRITIDDPGIQNSVRGDRHFVLRTSGGAQLEVEGTYALSNLLQEMVLASPGDPKTITIQQEHIFENPVQRTSRQIRELYWDGLTRQIDAAHLKPLLEDSKVNTDAKYLYVAHKDRRTLRYFRRLQHSGAIEGLVVKRLPRTITPEYLSKLDQQQGLLSLGLVKNANGDLEGRPFVVPGGRFNEMYGWDSYFIVLGLISDGRVDLARDMVDNLVYEIENYGKILNANRSYYLTRSQPPFLTSLALAVYEKLPHNKASQDWLRQVTQAAIHEYKQVWMDAQHLTETGLNRYYGTGRGIPPEVEPGHFDPILEPYAQKHHLSVADFTRAYIKGAIVEPGLDNFFVHDRAVRESGHDTTYRWRVGGVDRCADFVTVDLNCLLYKYEIDIAYVLRDVLHEKIEREGGAIWDQRAADRKALIRKFLWDPETQLFYDYYLPTGQRWDYISATTFYPLWACRQDEPQTFILNPDEAAGLIQQASQVLVAEGGILASARQSREKYGQANVERQWDYPYGWAPHQMIVWQGLINYGHPEAAQDLIYRWLFMITRNAADYNGTIPEKFDVVRQSHKVFAEYGNVGTEFSYITREGFGWMNASYQVGLDLLGSAKTKQLENQAMRWVLGFENRK